jgi:hypothetical protein
MLPYRLNNNILFKTIIQLFNISCIKGYVYIFNIIHRSIKMNKLVIGGIGLVIAAVATGAAVLGIKAYKASKKNAEENACPNKAEAVPVEAEVV